MHMHMFLACSGPHQTKPQESRQRHERSAFGRKCHKHSSKKAPAMVSAHFFSVREAIGILK